MYYEQSITAQQFEQFIVAIEDGIGKTFLGTEVTRKSETAVAVNWYSVMQGFQKIQEYKNERFKNVMKFTLNQTINECVKFFNANVKSKHSPDSLEDYVCVLGFSVQEMIKEQKKQKA